MIYRVRHITTYDYEDPVSVSHHILRLTPHNLCVRHAGKAALSVVADADALQPPRRLFRQRDHRFHSAGAA